MEDSYKEVIKLIDMKTHFITFSNTSYMYPDRILKEAESFKFDSIQSLSELDIPEFLEKHSNFINSNHHGFGRWIWKPKIILDKLKSIDDNDILIYCDSGMYLNSKGLNRYNEYLDILNEKDMVTFSLNQDGRFYFAQQWVVKIVIDSYYPEFVNMSNKYCYGGVIMMKKTKSTISLIEDWLGLCERYEFITGKLSFPEYDSFVGHDSDNGLFNICLVKHGISHYIFPDETNIYLPDGSQNYSASLEEWETLNEFPFQCRRIRPGSLHYEYYDHYIKK
jgi:hypothetical protein